jgi:hypothetical protein
VGKKYFYDNDFNFNGKGNYMVECGKIFIIKVKLYLSKDNGAIVSLQ